MVVLDSKSLVKLGKIGAPWGVKGFTRVQSYTHPESNIFDYKKWMLFQNNQWRVFELKAFQDQAKGLVAKLAGVETRDEAQSLTHAEIYVERHEMPECKDDEYYWADLEGLEVIQANGQTIGKVAYLYEAGAQDNMIVFKGKEEFHIPFLINETVLKVDLENKQIVVDWSVGE